MIVIPCLFNVATGKYTPQSAIPANAIKLVYTATNVTVYQPGDTLPANDADPGQAAVALTTLGTIATQGIAVARIAPAIAVTGIVMQPGAFTGQECIVINEAISAKSITFAAANSNVSIAATCVILGGMAKAFVWNAATALWYPQS